MDAGKFVRDQNELADQAARWVNRLALDALRRPETDPRLRDLEEERGGRMAVVIRGVHAGAIIARTHPDDMERFNQDRGL